MQAQQHAAELHQQAEPAIACPELGALDMAANINQGKAAAVRTALAARRAGRHQLSRLAVHGRSMSGPLPAVLPGQPGIADMLLSAGAAADLPVPIGIITIEDVIEETHAGRNQVRGPGP